MNDAEFEACESCVCFSARRAARVLTQYYDKYLRKVGLRSTQFTLLVALIRIDQAVPLNKIADILGLERTTLTRNLQPLITQGYIQYQPTEDRRIRLIGITERGTEMARKAFPLWQEAHNKVTEQLSPEAIQALAMSVSFK